MAVILTAAAIFAAGIMVAVPWKGRPDDAVALTSKVSRPGDAVALTSQASSATRLLQAKTKNITAAASATSTDSKHKFMTILLHWNVCCIRKMGAKIISL